MKYATAIETLLTRACPSIRYRIRKEILNEPVGSAGMKDLQCHILMDEKILEILSLRQEDGWLGGRFHGRKEPESGIRYLTEKGVEGDHPVIKGALDAILRRGGQFDWEALGHVGRDLDTYHLGGTQMIKACVFAYAGDTVHPFVNEQVAEALSGFEYVINLESLELAYRIHKDNIKVFRDGTRWPSIYHLRLLALTESWRNDENKRMLCRSVEKLAAFSPIPQIKLLSKSQVMGPASVLMYDFNPDMANMKDGEWMQWFHCAEMLARLGIANEVPAIKRQIDNMEEIISSNGGFFTKKLSSYLFNEWSQYVGLALENSWRTPEARINDLTFRSLLILKLAKRLERTEVAIE